MSDKKPTMTPYEEYKRIQEECDARGAPYPWAKPYKLIVAGDARVEMKSAQPLARSKCPKCGYTLTTNEQPSDWKCPVDGETLGSVPYP